MKDDFDDCRSKRTRHRDKKYPKKCPKKHNEKTSVVKQRNLCEQKKSFEELSRANKEEAEHQYEDELFDLKQGKRASPRHYKKLDKRHEERLTVENCGGKKVEFKALDTKSWAPTDEVDNPKHRKLNHKLSRRDISKERRYDRQTKHYQKTQMDVVNDFYVSPEPSVTPPSTPTPQRRRSSSIYYIDLDLDDALVEIYDNYYSD